MTQVQPLYKIVTVDDHPMFREGLKMIIESENIGVVIAEAENGQQLLDILEQHEPDLILMDIEMPVMNGLEATEKTLLRNPNLNILVFSMYSDKKYYSRLIKAGAKGMVLKTADKNEFVTAIKAVAMGDSFFPGDFLKNILIDSSNNQADSDSSGYDIKYTKRETEVLACLCTGMSAAEIAEKLCISIKTVEFYRSKLFVKTNTKNTVSLVIHAIKNKTVSL